MALSLFGQQLASTASGDQVESGTEVNIAQMPHAKSLRAVRQHVSSFRKRKTLDNIRVLVYIPTHLPEAHVDFLRKCWPSLIDNSVLLQHADMLLFTAREPPSDVLQDGFRGKKVRVERYNNTGYQQGAMLAMETATVNRWFDGYDWIIHVNPDVLILDDEWLIKTMLDDGVDGIFANCFDYSPCSQNCFLSVVNSDFFAVRPLHLGPTSFTEVHASNAEFQVTAIFRDIVDQGRDRWIAGTNMKGSCRIRGHGVAVLHAHSVLSQCPLAKGQPENRDIP